MNHAAQFKLRRMTWSDRAAVLQLQVSTEQLAFVDPIRDTLECDNHERVNFVLDADNTIIGFFQIAPSRHDAIVADLLVLHEVQIGAAYQGQGYGKQFMLALPSFLAHEYPQERGVCLTVNCENPQAYGLYKFGGFVDSGALYHGGRSGPQHIMQRFFKSQRA